MEVVSGLHLRCVHLAPIERDSGCYLVAAAGVPLTLQYLQAPGCQRDPMRFGGLP